MYRVPLVALLSSLSLTGCAVRVARSFGSGTFPSAMRRRMALTNPRARFGASSTVFSVVNTLLIRPLPFRDPASLVWIANSPGALGLSGQTMQVGHFLDLREQSKSFSDMAAYFAFYGVGDNKLTGIGGEPERLTSVPVSQNFFSFAARSAPPMSASGTALTSSFSATAYGSAASLPILISSVNLSRSTIRPLPSSAFFPLPLTSLQFSHREATSIFSIRFLSRRKRIVGATHSPWSDALNPAHQPKARKSNSPSSPSASLTIILSAMI